PGAGEIGREREREAQVRIAGGLQRLERRLQVREARGLVGEPRRGVELREAFLDRRGRRVPPERLLQRGDRLAGGRLLRPLDQIRESLSLSRRRERLRRVPLAVLRAGEVALLVARVALEVGLHAL